MVCSLFFSVNGQDLLKSGDLSAVKVDQLSDADITKLQQQLKSSGLTVSQAEQMAAAKGMPQTEIIKLRERLSHTETANRAAPAASVSDAKEPVLNEYKTVKKQHQEKFLCSAHSFLRRLPFLLNPTCELPHRWTMCWDPMMNYY